MSITALSSFRKEHPTETKVQKYIREHDIAWGPVTFNDAYHAGHVVSIVDALLTKSMQETKDETS